MASSWLGVRARLGLLLVVGLAGCSEGPTSLLLDVTGAAVLAHPLAAVRGRRAREREEALGGGPLAGHPELAGREAQAGTMTRESVGEQSSAGLNALSAAELDEMQRLNRVYRERHGFPFIIAVRRNTKQQIFEALRRRTAERTEIERGTALAEIGFITRGRINALLAG